MKTEEITLPKVSLKLLLGFGAQLGLRGSGPLGGLLQLTAEMNLSSRVALGVSARGTPILILKRCSTLLGHISLLSGLLPAPVFGVVEQTYFKVLPEFESAWCPSGLLGPWNSLATLPLISTQYIELDINPIVKSVAAPNPINVPPKEDHTSQVTVPLYLFNTVFGLLQTIGALDLDITLELVSSYVPLTTTELAALVPEVKEAPTVTLQGKKATVSIPANIHVLSYLPKGTYEAFFQLSGVMTLNPQLAPSATKLHLSLSLERLSVKLVSSLMQVPGRASRLEEWLSDVFRVAYMPKLNVNLDVGIPLPKVLNVNFANVALVII
ncbi:hypothetical protein EI555_004949, partial [Monodon monoceros]